MRRVKQSDKVKGMGKFGSREPLVIRGGIIEPVHKVVECGADKTRVNNRFNFIVFISVDKVQRGLGEVRAMGSGFAIRRYK